MDLNKDTVNQIDLVIHTDGGGQSSHDVGGKAAAAYVAHTKGGTYLGSRSELLEGTNNDAEYWAVLLAVRDLDSGDVMDQRLIRSVKFIGDSQLIIYQLTGRYRCKLPHLAAHRDEIYDIVNGLHYPVTFHWERREYNTEADCVCADAMVNGPKTEFWRPIPKDPRHKEVLKLGKSRRKAINKSRPVYAIEPFEPGEYSL